MVICEYVYFGRKFSFFRVNLEILHYSIIVKLYLLLFLSGTVMG